MLCTVCYLRTAQCCMLIHCTILHTNTLYNTEYLYTEIYVGVFCASFFSVLPNYRNVGGGEYGKASRWWGASVAVVVLNSGVGSSVIRKRECGTRRAGVRVDVSLQHCCMCGDKCTAERGPLYWCAFCVAWGSLFSGHSTITYITISSTSLPVLSVFVFA